MVTFLTEMLWISTTEMFFVGKGSQESPQGATVQSGTVPDLFSFPG